MSPPLMLVVWLAILSAQPTNPATIESPVVYRIAVPVALAALPTEMRPFFESHSAAIASATQTVITTGGRNAHTLPLDCAATQSNADPRRVAARQFPRDRDAAIEQLRRCGHDIDGEPLPWVVKNKQDSLVESLRRGEPQAIVRDAAALLHCSIDAALPFNATDDRWADAKSAVHDDRDSEPQSLRTRFQWKVPEQMRDRYLFEARVDPNRVRSVDNVIEAVFDALATAHEGALALEASDRDIAAMASGTRTVKPIVALNERSAPIIETQIEAGALLGARLIYSAWLEAGKPELQTVAAAPVAEAATKPTSPATSVSNTAPFVGSRSSKIFHRAGCSHAARIKPENRVYFDTTEQALRQGRTPCKTCKPG